MANLLNRIKINPDLKAYFSHFRKGVLTIVGLLVIAALIVGSFIYGNNERQAEETNGQPATQTAQESQATNQETEQSVTNNQSAGAGDDQEATPEPAGPSGGQPDTAELPSNGPATVAATGAEDWLAPLAGAALFLLARQYRQSRQGLAQAQLR